MKIASRMQKIKPSPTLAITAMANALKAEGKDIIGFGTGEPDFDTPENIKLAACRAIDSGITKYTPVGGFPALKKAVIDKFKRDNNLTYSPAEVTVSAGGKHTFYNVIHVLIDEGDEVIIPAPYWVSYPDIVLLAGGVPVIISTEDTSGFKITPAQLEASITPKTRAVIINSPSNPTGAVYSESELRALGEVLKKHPDVIILTDDIYEAIIYDGKKFTNIATLFPEMKEQIVVLNGVSKTYSMTGWRIGYMAASKQIIQAAEILQSQSISNPTSIAQMAAIEALTGVQDFLQTMVRIFDRRRKQITAGLNEVPGFSMQSPDGAFYAFPNIMKVRDLPGYKSIVSDSGSLSTDVTAYLLKEAEVAVVPGIAFGGDNYIRLSFATSDENIQKGIERIVRALKKLA